MKSSVSKLLQAASSPWGETLPINLAFVVSLVSLVSLVLDANMRVPAVQVMHPSVRQHAPGPGEVVCLEASGTCSPVSLMHLHHASVLCCCAMQPKLGHAIYQL